MSPNYEYEEWVELKIEDLHESEKYLISSYGRIRSFKNAPDGYLIKNTIVKGYEALIVKLKSEKYTTKYIHKLVAEHFIEKDSEYQKYVIHMDFNKRNNEVSNLCWVTRPTMFAHMKINPNYKRGIAGNSKLTEAQVISLKMKLKKDTGMMSTIAKEYGITQTQLNRIRRGENWAHVVLD